MVGITAMPSQQLPNEDAVAIATDFFHSMDNTANEVEHILKEIGYKDEKLNEIQQRLNARTTTLLRNARNSSTQPPFVTTINPITPKDQQSQQKINAEWAKINVLQQEKILLAERLVSIVTRHKERGREEYKKIAGDEAVDVLIKSEKDAEISLGSANGLASLVAQYTGTAGVGLLGGSIAVPRDYRPSAGSNISINTSLDTKEKKRKANGHSGHITPSYHDMPPPSLPSAHLPSNHSHASLTITPTHSSGHMTTPSYHQQIQLSSRAGRKGSSRMIDEEDVEMEMEAEGEADEGQDDNTLYCFCQEKSYGEMIGCDNDQCRFEWFHLKCVEVLPPLPETWFCPECVTALGFEDSSGTLKQSNKKSRKK